MTARCERIACIDGVDLWRMILDLQEEELARCWEALSPPDRERARRLSRPEVRRRFVAARAGLRRVLAGYIAVPPCSFLLQEGPHGKPELQEGPRFSLSHSGDLALCAVARDREVGVDVEQLRPVPEADSIARRWFSEEEMAAYRVAADARLDGAFLRSWTRREAFLKAIGLGLSDAEAGTAIDPERWELHEVRPGEGFVGALAVERIRGRPAISPPGLTGQ